MPSPASAQGNGNGTKGNASHAMNVQKGACVCAPDAREWAHDRIVAYIEVTANVLTIHNMIHHLHQTHATTEA